MKIYLWHSFDTGADVYRVLAYANKYNSGRMDIVNGSHNSCVRRLNVLLEQGNNSSTIYGVNIFYPLELREQPAFRRDPPSPTY
jgi:hypothetical protein